MFCLCRRRQQNPTLEEEAAWISVPWSIKTKQLSNDNWQRNIQERQIWHFIVYIDMSFISLGLQCFCLCSTASVNSPALQLCLVGTLSDQLVLLFGSTLVKVWRLDPLPWVHFIPQTDWPERGPNWQYEGTRTDSCSFRQTQSFTQPGPKQPHPSLFFVNFRAEDDQEGSHIALNFSKRLKDEEKNDSLTAAGPTVLYIHQTVDEDGIHTKIVVVIIVALKRKKHTNLYSLATFDPKGILLIMSSCVDWPNFPCEY